MRSSWIILPVLVVLAAAGAWWWTTHHATLAPVPAATAPAVTAPAAPAASATSAAEAAPAGPPPAPAEPLQAAGVPAALEALVGRKAVASLLDLDDFPRRIVATVDNLGRSHAPTALWPVHPTAGRFGVDGSADAATAAPDNAARYTPLVLLAESVDPAKAVALYLRMYPLLQAQYRALGFPHGEFNQRLLQVIGLLLATPEPAQAPQLHLLEVKGEVPSERPWVHYEFADPQLESLAAGQKILLRVGVVNERRLKKALAAFREELLRQAAR